MVDGKPRAYLIVRLMCWDLLFAIVGIRIFVVALVVIRIFTDFSRCGVSSFPKRSNLETYLFAWLGLVVS